MAIHNEKNARRYLKLSREHKSIDKVAEIMDIKSEIMRKLITLKRDEILAMAKGEVG